MGLRPTPETKTYSKTTRARNLPVRRRNKTAVRELAERTFNGHSFEAFLYYYSAFSKTEHELQGGEKSERRSSTNVPSDCAVWVRSWHTKDGGIMSEMSTSMRAPSVVPRYAVAVGSLKVCRGGTAIWKTPEERGNFN